MELVIIVKVKGLYEANERFLDILKDHFYKDDPVGMVDIECVNFVMTNMSKGGGMDDKEPFDGGIAFRAVEDSRPWLVHMSATKATRETKS